MIDAQLPCLQGAPNFRDLGGFRTQGRCRVVRGRLFRSGNFANLTAADVEYLRGIPLRTVVDLRGPAEQQMYPSRFPPDFKVTLVNAVVNPYARADAGAYKKILLDEPNAHGALKTIAATYRLLPDACGPALKVAVDNILASQVPLVFHCANGRDRTGIIATLLLHLLGVDRADIVADYVESNSRIDLEAAIRLSNKTFVKEYGVDFDYDTLRTLNQALEQNIDIAFDTIRKVHGSTERYLQTFGIDAVQQQALREALLEPADQ